MYFQPFEKHRDIFQRYNEYGDRVAFTPASKTRPHLSAQKPQLRPLVLNGDSAKTDFGIILQSIVNCIL